MFCFYNANPTAARVGDCTVRAISKATGQSWEETFINMCLKGLILHDMPSANHVWGSYLEDLGFKRKIIPDTCPHCYTVRRFAEENPEGAFVLAISGHVVAVINGNYFDTWDSGDEVPLYYWEKEKDQ